jgi:hypothetical protein
LDVESNLFNEGAEARAGVLRGARHTGEGERAIGLNGTDQGGGAEAEGDLSDPDS